MKTKDLSKTASLLILLMLTLSIGVMMPHNYWGLVYMPLMIFSVIFSFATTKWTPQDMESYWNSFSIRNKLITKGLAYTYLAVIFAVTLMSELSKV